MLELCFIECELPQILLYVVLLGVGSSLCVSAGEAEAGLIANDQAAHTSGEVFSTSGSNGVRG